MKTFRTIKLLTEVAMVTLWVLGFLFPEQKLALWAFPAGFCVGGIIFDWQFQAVRNSIKQKVETKFKSINLNSKDAPPELREKMEALVKAIAEHEGAEDFQMGQKCTDPHCPNCWGLGDKPEL